MANKKITELPLVTSSSASDDIPIVQRGATSRIHPGPGGGFDADMVSGAGVGVSNVTRTQNAALDSFTTDIRCRVSKDSTGSNFPGASVDGYLTVHPFSLAGYTLQEYTDYGGNGQWYRVCVASTWQPWQCLSDGLNGGQPPAPKPTTGTPAGGANGPGQRINATISAGANAYHSGSTNLTGTWDIWIFDYITASNLFIGETTLTGSGLIQTVPAGHTWCISTTRQS